MGNPTSSAFLSSIISILFSPFLILFIPIKRENPSWLRRLYHIIDMNGIMKLKNDITYKESFGMIYVD
jgi:hypothetical protein